MTVKMIGIADYHYSNMNNFFIKKLWTVIYFLLKSSYDEYSISA